jgi:hypothetical protein
MGGRLSRSLISVELSEEQLQEVLCAARERGRDLRGLGDLDVSPAVLRKAAGGSLSNSLIRGLLVLSVFVVDGPARGVTEIAAELNMKTSTVHRLMRTLANAGLLEHDRGTRSYRRVRPVSR